MSQRTNLLPTLFLDFDGVLHPGHAKPADFIFKMPMFAEAIGSNDVRIIVSSSWRFQLTYNEIESRFPVSLRKKIDGVTGDAFVGRHARWQEIQACVRSRGISNWRALDDSRFEFPVGCTELIWCEGSRGIEQAQVVQIRTWLSQV